MLAVGRTPARRAASNWANVHEPMPVALSGVMLVE